MHRADTMIKQRLEATQYGLPGIARNQKIATDPESHKRYENRLAMDIHRWYSDKENPLALSDHLKQAGHAVRGVDTYTADYGPHIYDEVMEHPSVQRYNDLVDPPGRRGGAGVLSTVFGSLHRKKAEFKDHALPQYIFHAGRMGNTHVIMIDGPQKRGQLRAVPRQQTEGTEEWPMWTVRHKSTGGIFAKRRAPNGYAAVRAALDTHPTLKHKDFEFAPGDVGARPGPDVGRNEKHCYDCGGPATRWGSCLARCGS